MGGRPELGRKKPLPSSVLTEARGCLALEGATEVVSATKDAVDEADGGAQVVAAGIGMAASCVSVRLAEANHAGMETVSHQSSTEPAREAWLCSVVDLLREKQWGRNWGNPKSG